NWLQAYHGYLESDNQHWDLIPHPDPKYATYYHIGKGGKYGDPYRQCVSLDHGHTNAGTLLTMQSCNLWKETQLWKFEEPDSASRPVPNLQQSNWTNAHFLWESYATPGLCVTFNHNWDTHDGIFWATNDDCHVGQNLGYQQFEIVTRDIAGVRPAACGTNGNDKCNVQIKDSVGYPGGLCLDILNGDAHHGNGDWVQGYHCFGESKNQRWNIIVDPKDTDDPSDISDPHVYVHIQSATYPDFCLGLWAGDDQHPGNHNGDDGAQMVISYCNLFSPVQKFYLLADGSLAVKSSGKCLD
ncbi:hypothetical protein HDU76_011894, partial [Blyttiomyces sp. JEL0837]